MIALLPVLALFTMQLQLSGASTSSKFETEFGYSGWNGPNTNAWPPLCHTGKYQSPINIDLASAVSSTFPAINFVNYDYRANISVTNNGHSVAASGFDQWGSNGSMQPYITGGGLDGQYNLIGFHFHWGTHDNTGSEHTLDNLHFPLEAHFVHQKATLTAAQAMNQTDGLAVVGVWFRIDNRNGRPLKQLERAFDNTDSYGQTYNIRNVLLSEMLPSNRGAFFRYNGSLTTPGCNEVVVWTILEQPVSVTDYQLMELRQHTSTLGNILHNFRNVQKLDGRKVLKT